MLKTELLFLLLPCCFFPETVSIQFCYSVNSSHYGVTWPTTHTKRASRPPCVGKSKEFLFRECINGVWGPEPDCDYVQPTTRPQCPQWVEASSMYKMNVDDVYYVYSGKMRGKDCILYYNSSYIEAISCKEEHFGICAYSKFKDLSHNMCANNFFSDCRRSDFAITSKCFCVGAFEEEPVYRLAEFVEPYQNFYPEDASNIGLGQDEVTGTYTWKNSKLEAKYTSWAQDQKFDKNYSFVVTTADGWILSEFLRNKSIYEIETTVAEPSIQLKSWDQDIPSYSLEIDNSEWIKLQPNSEYLIYCFTNGYSGDSTLRREPTFVEGILILSLDGGLRYDELWCEGFRYPDLQNVRSNTISFEPKYEFIAMFRVQYPEGMYPLGSRMIRFLQEFLNSSMESYDSRVMKIEDLDEETRTLLINVQISPKHLNEHGKKEIRGFYVFLDMNKEYESIQNTLKSKQRTNITLLELRSYEYCLAEKRGILYWPQTNVGQLAFQEEYCFKSDGTLLRRWCKRKNFVDGAQWGEVEDCNIPEKSQVTMYFFNILNNKTLCKTMEISHNPAQINSFDIYLLVDVMVECFKAGMHRSVYLNIYDSIMKVNKSILEKSEKEMRATTRLLTFFHWLHYVEYQGTSTVVKDKFIDARLFLKNQTGMVLVKKSNAFEVQQLTEEALEKIIAIENLESAIWLTPQLRSMIRETHIASFTFFLSNDLFVEEAAFPKNIEKVFSVFLEYYLSNYYDPNAPLWYLQHVSNESYYYDPNCQIWYFQRVSNESPRSCVSWRYADERGYWETNVEAEEIHSNYVVCKFPPSSGYYAIATYKLTDRLHDLGECNGCSVSQTMKNLLNCSKEHENFSPTDVHLTAQILKKISGDANVNLTVLADVISNLEQVESSVLEEAQQKNGSIDRILQNIDEILKNYNYHSPLKITKGNFTIGISKLQDMDFHDLMISSKEIQFQKNGDSLENYLENHKFEAALHFDEKLKTQINKNSTIITTVFKNDVLFRSKESKYTTVGKIFGVMVPDIENFSGPISIFHKISSGKPAKCVHWKYNQTSNGFWVSDGEARHKSGLVECQFWQAAHFALLIDRFLEDPVLDYITLINCSLSLFGLLCIVITAIVFKQWRSKLGNQILLNFVVAMILQIVVFFVSSGVFAGSYHYCTAIGAVLHYSVISEFCWMLIIAFLQYKRFVEVLDAPPDKILWKACICGWGLPVVPVVLVLILGSYVDGNHRLCYPFGRSLYFGVWLPVSIVLTINFGFFCYIMGNVVGRKSPRRHGRNKESIFHWRLGILLFFILGLTWTFGFLAELYTEVFVYLFCATATLQGFILFLFFIVLNEETRKLYFTRTVVYHVNKK